MMLRLAPQLVKDYKRAEPVGFGFGFEPAYRGWTTKDRTVTGHIGHPQDGHRGEGRVPLRDLCGRRGQAARERHRLGRQELGDAVARRGSGQVWINRYRLAS